MNAEPLTILHVEDNSDHADLVARSLRRNRIARAVYLAEDGEQALDYLFRRGNYQDPKTSPRPDIVLLDLRLPKVDGLDVLQALKNSGELLSIPVVVLTSSEAEKDILEAYDYHANSYLVKPVGFEEFNKMMELIGMYWLDWNSYVSPSMIH